MKLSSRDQMIVAGVVVVLIAVAFAFLLIVPQFTALSQAKSDAAKADQDILAAKQLLEKRQEAKSAAAETEAKLTRLENQMPDAPEMPAVIIDLQDSANDAGLDFDSLAVTRPAAAGDGFQNIQLSFVVVGAWDDVNDYLSRLGRMQRGVRVLNISVRPRDADTANGSSSETTATKKSSSEPLKLVADVKLEVYMVPRTNAPAAAAPGAPTATSSK